MEDNKEFLIAQEQYDEMEDEGLFDDMVDNEIENAKLEDEENIVLLKNLLSELLSEKQRDILSCLVDNAIESDTDYLNDISGEEKEHYKSHISDLKEIKLLI